MDKGHSVVEGALDSTMMYLDKNNGAKVAKKSMLMIEGSDLQMNTEKCNVQTIPTHFF